MTPSRRAPDAERPTAVLAPCDRSFGPGEPPAFTMMLDWAARLGAD
jgi:hypothetical protein